MKYTLFITGLILIVINTISGLIFQGYAAHKMLFADFSITLTIGLLYLMYQVRTADGFKIGLSFFFLLSGVARFLCAVFSIEQMENNIAIIIFMCFIAIEAISYFAAKYLSSK